MKPNYKIPPGPKPGPWGPTKPLQICLPIGLIDAVKQLSVKTKKAVSRIIADLIANEIGQHNQLVSPALAYIERSMQALSDEEMLIFRRRIELAHTKSPDTTEPVCPEARDGLSADQLDERTADSVQSEGHLEQQTHSRPEAYPPLEPSEGSHKE